MRYFFIIFSFDFAFRCLPREIRHCLPLQIFRQAIFAICFADFGQRFITFDDVLPLPRFAAYFQHYLMLFSSLPPPATAIASRDDAACCFHAFRFPGWRDYMPSFSQRHGFHASFHYAFALITLSYCRRCRFPRHPDFRRQITLSPQAPIVYFRDDAAPT